MPDDKQKVKDESVETAAQDDAQLPEPQIEEVVESRDSSPAKPDQNDNDETPVTEPAEELPVEKLESADERVEETQPEQKTEEVSDDQAEATDETPAEEPKQTPGKWYVVHTFAGHENRVATTLKQRIEAEHLENLIFDILVPTQDKIEIRAGKKETVKEKIFPGYILVKMELNDASWLAVRTTQGVTSFVGMGNKPTPISEAEVNTIVKFTTQGAQPTFKDVFMVDDTVKIVDGPFSEFIGKVDSVDKEKGRVRVLVSIFGRETPVELDFLQVQKL